MLLLLLCYLAVSDGRAAGAPALPPEGSAPEAILSEARLSLAEARGHIPIQGLLLAGIFER